MTVACDLRAVRQQIRSLAEARVVKEWRVVFVDWRAAREARVVQDQVMFRVGKFHMPMPEYLVLIICHTVGKKNVQER